MSSNIYVDTFLYFVRHKNHCVCGTYKKKALDHIHCNRGLPTTRIEERMFNGHEDFTYGRRRFSLRTIFVPRNPWVEQSRREYLQIRRLLNSITRNIGAEIQWTFLNLIETFDAGSPDKSMLDSKNNYISPVQKEDPTEAMNSRNPIRPIHTRFVLIGWLFVVIRRWVSGYKYHRPNGKSKNNVFSCKV